jgi:hypothetical protein
MISLQSRSSGADDTINNRTPGANIRDPRVLPASIAIDVMTLYSQ